MQRREFLKAAASAGVGASAATTTESTASIQGDLSGFDTPAMPGAATPIVFDPVLVDMVKMKAPIYHHPGSGGGE